TASEVPSTLFFAMYDPWSHFGRADQGSDCPPMGRATRAVFAAEIVRSSRAIECTSPCAERAAGDRESRSLVRWESTVTNHHFDCDSSQFGMLCSVAAALQPSAKSELCLTPTAGKTRDCVCSGRQLMVRPLLKRYSGVAVALAAAALLTSCAVGPDFLVPSSPETDRYTREPWPPRTSA